ncbi:MAG: hypothetical protein KDA32_02315 [Phycisphaerales bacterium]|nr:hypothetical protein [Phycisphaerales bacterium]
MGTVIIILGGAFAATTFLKAIAHAKVDTEQVLDAYDRLLGEAVAAKPAPEDKRKRRSSAPTDAAEAPSVLETAEESA